MHQLRQSAAWGIRGLTADQIAQTEAGMTH
jgi:hypothetical protein